MKKIKLLLILTSLLLTGSCSTTSPVKVNYEVNPAITTSTYKTFSWLTKEHVLVPSSELNPITRLKISNAIENELISKGYSIVKSEANADFTVSYTVGSRAKIKVNSFPVTYSSFGWGRGYYGGYHRMGVVSHNEATSYNEGYLAIDFYDVNSKQPVWHGWATKRLSSQDNKSKDQLIKDVVSQLLTHFNR